MNSWCFVFFPSIMLRELCYASNNSYIFCITPCSESDRFELDISTSPTSRKSSVSTGYGSAATEPSQSWSLVIDCCEDRRRPWWMITCRLRSAVPVNKRRAEKVEVVYFVWSGYAQTSNVMNVVRWKLRKRHFYWNKKNQPHTQIRVKINFIHTLYNTISFSFLHMNMKITKTLIVTLSTCIRTINSKDVGLIKHFYRLDGFFSIFSYTVLHKPVCVCIDWLQCTAPPASRLQCSVWEFGI